MFMNIPDTMLAKQTQAETHKTNALSLEHTSNSVGSQGKVLQ
jgi:hypothetical protein